ncbi:unnamed protein product [Caenorhabditis angaria]|uniref:Piwi domain-containing protein n=1 Tax=Caenorhabditis angaria TaxID=860376 RepID=A0A9P1N4V7_9PELO|nr:unnamed protein product [Caenorhabditis angaria]
MSLEAQFRNLQLAPSSKWYPRPTEKCSGEFYTEKQKLLVNWFRLAKNCTGKLIFEYKVEVLKEVGRKEVPVQAKNRVKLFWTLCRNGDFPVQKLVYDDFETVYSHEQFPQEKYVYKMKNVPEAGNSRRPDVYVLKISYLNNFKLGFSRRNPEADDEIANRSQKFLKCLFTQKFRYSPSDAENPAFFRDFTNDRNSIIHIPTIDLRPKFEVAPGIGAWMGIYFAVRETDKYEPVLNFGLVHKLFYSIPRMNLLDYMLILIDEKTHQNDELRENYKLKIQKNEFGMSQTQRDRARHLLKDLRLKAENVPDRHQKFVERHVSFIEFTEQIAQNYVLREIHGTPTMLEYYAHFRLPLRFPAFPLALCKSGKKELLLPIEILFIHETGQRFKNHLDFNMRTQFVRGATLPPQEHKKSIEAMLEKFDFGPEGGADLPLPLPHFLRSFDVSPKLEMIECVGKVLKEPQLVNRENQRIEMTQDVRGFREKVLNIVPRGKLAVGLIVLREDGKEAACVNERDLQEFYTLLMDVCIERGLPIEENENRGNRSLFRVFSNVACFNGPENFQTAIHHTIHQFNQLPEPEKAQKSLFFLIIHKKSYEAYGRIKFICDTEIGVANQVIDETTVRKAIREAQEGPESGLKASKKIFYNIALKINAKLGGVNQEIGFSEDFEMSPEEKEKREKEPLIMYVGIDVTHPTEGSGIDFSIAGIVASINRGATRYIPAVVAQMEKNPDVRKAEKGQPNLKKSREITDILEGKFVAILQKFAETNRNRLPDKIVILRDGISDSEMLENAHFELKSLRNEVAIFMGNRENSTEKEPEYTYIVVQKRHKTRFYRVSEENLEKSTGILNPKSGTVADKTVVSPYKFDFWLTSQHGALGTSRPGHYTVLFDNSGMTKDQVYKMCYELSFLSARCRKPISIPAPIHYAHLTCEKAKEIFKATKKGLARPEKERMMIEQVLQPNRCYPGMSFV